MTTRRNRVSISLAMTAVLGFIATCAFGQTNVVVTPATHPTGPATPAHKLKAADADNHTIYLNRPGVISLVLGTNEDSQDAARAAGKAMYAFQGRPDFQLFVVVDLRDSIATWAPSIVLSRMRANLDSEAIELKPYYLKNGNKSNPRKTSYAIADFSGTICPQLGWAGGSDDLRGILFGADGRELERWDKITDWAKLDADVRAAIQTLIDAGKNKSAAAVKAQGSKLMQTSTAHPPLLPPTPPPPSD